MHTVRPFALNAACALRRQPFEQGNATRSLRFVTHLQTPKATAVQALLGGLARLLKAAR